MQTLEDVSGSLSVVDNRTGKSVEIPIRNGVIAGAELGKLKAEKDGPGLRMFDPGYMNTASCKSKITYIDGDKGILMYRGYAIEELAEKSTFMETAFLLFFGELPTAEQLGMFRAAVAAEAAVPENVVALLRTFRHDAHPMSMLASAVAALGACHPEGNPAVAGEKVYRDPAVRLRQAFRLLGKASTLAAAILRVREGRPVNQPSASLDYAANFLAMLDRPPDAGPGYEPHPVLARALDVLFMLHADHELNCSTAAMRHLASSGVDVYTATAGAVGALYGPLHGGANEAVLRMLAEIGSVEAVPRFVEDVKAKRRLLYGFGHRVYKNYDPRARLVRRTAEEVFAVTGREGLLEVAQALEKTALSDPYFVERKLYPNVDFYSGLIYKALGFPPEYFTVLFAVPRTAGWLAHWLEHLDDPEQKIVRPQQVYLGHPARPYPAPLAARPASHPAPRLPADAALPSAAARRAAAGRTRALL
eukprot:tig00000711_g3365.t1